MKRGRPASHQQHDTNSDIPQEHAPGITSFMKEMDLELSDSHELPPPAKLLNTALREASSLHLLPPPSLPMKKKPPTSTTLERPQQQVRLPRTFQQVTEFPGDKSFLITTTHSPYFVIYANPTLEKLWNRKLRELVDKPLQGFCVDHTKLNAVACTVFHLHTAQNKEVKLSFDLGDRVMTHRVHVGPLYLDNDPSQLNDAQYLLWHPVES